MAAGFFINLTPLFAALLSAAFLGEAPHLYHGAAIVLVVGGIDLVRQTMDTATVATGINMTFVNGTLPLMAIVVFIIRLRELVATFKRPASSFKAKGKED